MDPKHISPLIPPSPEEQTEWERLAEELALKNRALAATSEGITITDVSLPDNPIIFANEGFKRLTGYSDAEIIGYNCRFLQGPDTDPQTVAEIRSAIAEERECTVDILNYRKDGSAFWNRLTITPVRDADNKVTHFIGIQSDISERKRAEEALARAKEQLETVNRRMTRDLETAANIQQALLPRQVPAIEGIEIYWTLRPCSELAGDTLNIVSLDETHYGIYILDVSGHGVPAALLSVTLNHWLSPLPAHSSLYKPAANGSGEFSLSTPREVVEKLNARFPMSSHTLQYFTILYGILDTVQREFCFSVAGHPGPMLLPRARQGKALQFPAYPIGFVDHPSYKQHCIKLHPGDRLYMYTDGVVEARNADFEHFGRERLMQEIERSRDVSLRESLVNILASLETWHGDSDFADDLSLMALEVH